MTEIAGAPMSRHDFAVLDREIAAARSAALCTISEIIVSSLRVREPFKAFGIPVRPSDGLRIHEGMLVIDGREPRWFGFEADD